MANKSKSGFMLLIGAILGGVAALFFGTDKQGKTKKAVQKKVKQSKEALSEAVSRDKLVEIFGEDSEKYLDQIQDMRDKASEQLAKLHKAGKKIDKDKYKEVVEDLVAKFTKKEDVTPGQMKKLTSYLASDFKALKNSLEG